MLTGVYDPPVKMEVFLDTRASGMDRKTAYAYNLGCFTTLTGCKSVYEILLTVRQQAMGTPIRFAHYFRVAQHYTVSF